MKICAVICEYNPFHNGHKRMLDEIRRQSGCEKILCVMSGNFTQRGEEAVFHKLRRARHAVENGADAVIELPTAFAVSPAELFAYGAVRLVCDIPAVTTLAFGCESGDREAFINAAAATLREDKSFRNALKENMKDGTPYIKARNAAILSMNTDVDEALLSSPNNILGTEYCRSLISLKSNVQPLPLLRTGAGYADGTLYANFSSATALRGAMREGTRRALRALKGNLPTSVFQDVRTYQPLPYSIAALCALLASPAEKIAFCPDCSEGLENRLKAFARSNPTYEGTVEKTVTKRYTRSRVKRILLQNFLGVSLKDVKNFCESPLYHNVLAVKKEGAEELLSALSQGSFPVIARRSDFTKLQKDAAACFALDVRANDLYNALSGEHTNEFETAFV